MDASTIAQVNVRMDRTLKERGDDTLRLAGSTPVRIIRQLWECLASGGDAYERVMAALSPAQEGASEADASLLVQHSASLFEGLGESLGLSSSAFKPDLRPEKEILEEVEWELLAEKELV